jgi:hypothetical protein
MKRAVLREKISDMVYPDCVTDRQIVIVQSEYNTCIVTSIDFYTKQYKLMCLNSKFTAGNHAGGTFRSLEKLIKDSIKLGCKVFVFDSMKEAALWIAENI